MLKFNSKLDNSISGTEENVKKAIAAFNQYLVVKSGLSGITDSNILQALLDSPDPSTETSASISTTIASWRAGKAPGKVTWCTKRGLINNYQLTDLSTLYSAGRITYKEYNVILLSKIWVSDGENAPALFTNVLKILSLVDDTRASFADAFLTAYNTLVGKSYTRTDLHAAEIQQLSSIVSSAGIDSASTGRPIKDTVKEWGCQFDSIVTPHYGFGVFPDFYWTEQINQYVGNTINGVFEAVFTNPSAFNRLYPHINVKSINDNNMQKIYYGAPGTGKSNEIKLLTGEGKDGIKFNKDFTFRTTFHPDSDYSSFVGAYKPVWDNSKDKIVYEFRPQTFLKAYVAAWTHPEDQVALVIEEINRGNCAQIFGDIFQLLDRETNGLSKYPIEADIDMKTFIVKAFDGSITESWAGVISEADKTSINDYYSTHYDDAFAKIKSGDILSLPKNLSILATMNTSDQSLFPMDSAFKRRWEWAYQPIVKGVDSSTGKDLNWVIDIEGYEPIDWWEFLQRINRVVSDLTTSEDKQLGYFFCIPDKKKNPTDDKPTIITAKRFVGKVIFYLWNDVFKDYAFDAPCCKGTDEKEVLYAKFYSVDGKSINYDVLAHFFDTLKDGSEDSLIRKTPAPPAPVGSPVTVPTTSESTDGSHATEEPESGSAATESGEVEDSSSTVEE